MISIYLQSFMLISLIVIRVTSRTNNEQRAITPKLGKAELRFLCTALLFDETCLHWYLSWFQSYVPDKVKQASAFRLCSGQDSSKRGDNSKVIMSNGFHTQLSQVECLSKIRIVVSRYDDNSYHKYHQNSFFPRNIRLLGSIKISLTMFKLFRTDSVN
jgi:hypothetical protein